MDVTQLTVRYIIEEYWEKVSKNMENDLCGAQRK